MDKLKDPLNNTVDNIIKLLKKTKPLKNTKGDYFEYRLNYDGMKLLLITVGIEQYEPADIRFGLLDENTNYFIKGKGTVLNMSYYEKYDFYEKIRAVIEECMIMNIIDTDELRNRYIAPMMEQEIENLKDKGIF